MLAVAQTQAMLSKHVYKDNAYVYTGMSHVTMQEAFAHILPCNEGGSEWGKSEHKQRSI